MPESTVRWFVKIEVELATGRALHFQLTRQETEQLADNRVRDPADDLALARAAFSTLVMRVEKDTGELILPEADGRLWIMPTTRIVAIAFAYRDGPSRELSGNVGFRDRPAAK